MRDKGLPFALPLTDTAATAPVRWLLAHCQEVALLNVNKKQINRQHTYAHVLK